jgi:regulator of protease activity HflC (stomatin/prohibitin superfamily)
MGWAYILGIISVAVILYLFGSLRVLRQYERGVVFFLGKFEGVRGPGITLIFIPIQQMVRVSLRTVTMQIPLAKDHHQGQRLDRYCRGRLLPYFRS